MHLFLVVLNLTFRRQKTVATISKHWFFSDSDIPEN